MTQRNEHYPLGIGEVMIIRDGGVISTVLGSCVSLCLYSTDGSIGGMNHFVLPSPIDPSQGDERESFRYGDNACKVLIETVLAQSGVVKKNLRAKIIGGASILKGEGISRDIGLQNVEMARKLCKTHGIEIAGEDTGGTEGRKIFFFTASGKVRVSFLDAKSVEVPRPETPKKVARKEADLPAPETSRFLGEEPRERPIAIDAKEKEKEKEKTRVLIVDDSKTIQEFLKKIFEEDKDLVIVGVANHPLEAEEILSREKVDVMTLDIQMPVMDGITFLEKRMAVKPLPVVMLTSMRMEDGDHVLRALELGAVDYIQKPRLQDIASMGKEICEKVKSAAKAQIGRKFRQKAVSVPKEKPRASEGRGLQKGMPYIAIGASTGGTVALTEVLTALPANIPPIVIVQHIPAGFSRAFADRLNSLCPFEVKEAVDGDELCMNRVLIAPGGKQMLVEMRGGRFVAAINDDDPVNRHKPSVDYLFDSVAKNGSAKVLGIILTGMGADGARGMLAMKQGGAFTIAQDEKSSVVYGMPKEAVKAGGVDKSLALEAVAGQIERWMAEVRAVA